MISKELRLEAGAGEEGAPRRAGTPQPLTALLGSRRQPLPAPTLPGASSRRGERRKGKAWETETALCCSHKALLFGGLRDAF